MVIKQAIEVNGQNIQKNKENIAANDTAIKANLASINSLKTRVTKTEQDITANKTAVEERVTTLESTSSDHESRIKTNETTLADHEKRITTNASDIDKLETRATNLESTVGEHTVSIESHESRLNNIETTTDAGKWAEKIAALDAKDETLEAKDTELEKKITSNTTNITKNTDAITAETQARQEADTALSTSVQNEIQPKIDALTSGLSQEVTDRTKAISDLKTSLSSDYVTLKTAQDITAVKTIVLPSNQHAIKVKDTGTANSDPLSATVWQSIAIALDKNNKERGCLQATLGADGFSCTKLMAIQQNAKGVNLYNTLELGIKADGTQTSKIGASPVSNSNDTSIATTAWVNTKISASATSINSNKVTVETAQTISGAKTFTNAIIAPDIELTAPYPFIDFHFNNSTADYTSRIVAEANAYLHCSGTFAADAFKALSDKNYKKDITSVSYDLSKLKSYRYKFKNDKSGSWYVGLIAQEVQEIIPEAVTKTKTKDGDYLTLDYNAIVAALVTEVNQLKKRIEVLENK